MSLPLTTAYLVEEESRPDAQFFGAVSNVVVGFIQEYGSAKTMDSLRSLASPNAQVLRDAKIHTIPSPQVVTGDVVEVKTGDTIPADMRLIETVNFETDEALLTGESLPVAKSATANWDAEAKAGGFDPRDVGVGGQSRLLLSPRFGGIELTLASSSLQTASAWPTRRRPSPRAALAVSSSRPACRPLSARSLNRSAVETRVCARSAATKTDMLRGTDTRPLGA